MKDLCLYYFVIVLAIQQAHAGRDGASSTSCYTHVITHLRFGTPETVLSCERTDDRCRNVLLTPFCPDQEDPVCCRDFQNKVMYTKCNYTFQWNLSTNLGYLVQARVIEGEQNKMFDSSTTIIGTWYGGFGHKPLLCNSSSSATDEEPVPNSVTHSGLYTEDNPNAPPNINLTWSANTTMISADQQEESSRNITFFYTIARDISTNFYPYTRQDLFFLLKPFPPPSSPKVPGNSTFKRGGNPPRISSSCMSNQDREDIFVEVLQFLSQEFSVSTLGLARIYAADSCAEVLNNNALIQPGVYWIRNGTDVIQQYCKN